MYTLHMYNIIDIIFLSSGSLSLLPVNERAFGWLVLDMHPIRHQPPILHHLLVLLLGPLGKPPLVRNVDLEGQR